ncbi:MAG: sigma-70 family RNA polymerase sigma factor [Actinomycetota bacterium]|nr:MAG: sigma-70 family RNA polymerase sigma factor [Actinomycetota bacterium]
MVRRRGPNRAQAPRSTDLSTLSDEALLARSLTEPEVFAQLVGRHGRRIGSYLLRRLPPAEAEDVLSEAWLVAFDRRHTYDASRGEVGAWLFGIARTLLVATARRWAAAERLEARIAGLRQDDAADWDLVDGRLAAAMMSDRLRIALDELPVEEREVVLLVAWEECTPTQAAQALGIPAGTARSRLHRARARLQPQLLAEAGMDPA